MKYYCKGAVFGFWICIVSMIVFGALINLGVVK